MAVATRSRCRLLIAVVAAVSAAEPRHFEAEAPVPVATYGLPSPRPNSDSSSGWRREGPAVQFIVCRHAGPGDEDFNASFALIAALGATGVRTDAAWAAIEPTRGKYADDALDYYRRYFQSAVGVHNLSQSMLILSSPPDWAAKLWHTSRQEFLAAWGAFCRTVMAQVAFPAGVRSVQLWNEGNGFPSLEYWVDMPDIIATAGEAVSSVQASVSAAASVKRFVNPNCDFLGWGIALALWCERAGHAFDGIGVDHYPHTWAGEGWDPLVAVLNRTNTAGDACFGKTPALLETGYSTFAPSLGHGEAQGAAWVSTDLVAALEIVRDSQRDAARYPHPVNLVSYYELFDEGSSRTFPAEEAHFGLLRGATATSERKPAFEALRRVVALYGSGYEAYV